MHEFTLRPSPASWRGRGSPRFFLAGPHDSPPVWPVLGLAVVALAAAAGLAVWMLTHWPAA
ncbi:MAG: hypothetical protein IT562_10360 [Alphaproteobacteria bacterium]|nr:hypothetical protein [Alphaproteobacteria bacterium]